MRRTFQRPAGGVQSSVPSAFILDVRSSTSFRATASLGLTEGVANWYKSDNVANAAFSSNRFTRAPLCKTSSVILWSAAGGGNPKLPGSERSNSIGGSLGDGAGVAKLTRKYLAATGENATVFCAALLKGTF